MALVLVGHSPANPACPTTRVQAERAEIVEHRGMSSAQHLELLLGQAAIAAAGIHDGADRAIAKAEREQHVVGRARGDRLGKNRRDWRAHQIDQQIEHVAHLADQPPAALDRIDDPRCRRDGARIDPIRHHQRPAALCRGELRLQLLVSRRETAVEADLQHASARVGGIEEIVELVGPERHRLFKKHRFACPQGRGGDGRVQIVSRGDEDCVDELVVEHLLPIRGGIAESKSGRCLLRAGRRGSRHTAQLDVQLFHGWQQDRSGEAARTDNTEAHGPRRQRSRGAQIDAGTCWRRAGWSAGILEQDAERGFGNLACNDLVRTLGLGDRHAMGDQPRRSHRARGDEVEEAFHVALLGPADIADRVINSVLLIGWVVATGTVRPR